jgi:hypothetical protein
MYFIITLSYTILLVIASTTEINHIAMLFMVYFEALSVAS